MLKPSAEIRQRFNELFSMGLTAAEAAAQHRSQVDFETDGDELVLADANVVPLIRTVQYWHQLRTGKKFGYSEEEISTLIAVYEKDGHIVRSVINKKN